MSAHVNMCVSMSAQGCPAGALAVGLVYVATRLKVRGEGGGAWSALGPLKSPTPFSHLTNGWWGGGVLTLNLNLFSTTPPQKCTVSSP